MSFDTWDSLHPSAPEQPMPTPESGTPVWPEALAAAEDVGCGPDLLDAMRARDLMGRERYGTRLCRNNGRSFERDCIEEMLDAYVYAVGTWGPESRKARAVLSTLMLIWARS